ncbi:alkaline phosphatase D family protein [Ktedonobacter racemifer]|uniref:Phosphodiesterase/alkaline phosphatase D n=1 Tax=Ktedonobacter racemifer DSM 44963 TaxID=485913 RepID=D6TKH7_KTERA|nr:alkaline phosphatase D family protein [Ktedonobacter racemifer]EFH86277.1 Phosphodiesterase/alkaline phosphatase D [Ktedonobacter racemifer DSM 44963]
MALPLIGPIVRATTASEVVIWAEFARPCKVTVSATPLHNLEAETVQVTASTLLAGGHAYLSARLSGLQPSTWYTYALHVEDKADDGDATQSALWQGFRTFAAPGEANKQPLRVAYGSCRKLDQPEKDTLAAFGRWLREHSEQREQEWPHLLLMIGDQIYADQPSPSLVAHQPELAQGASRFDEFALLYQHAWSSHEDVRQALAALPTFMLFDDHEITNNWNAEPNWQEEALRQGQEQTIVDGLVAYWLYQGWGNLLPGATLTHPLLDVTQTALQSGRDCLDDLRACVRTTLTGATTLPWHYTVATQPAIFVTNTRTERTAQLTSSDEALYAPTAIMGEQQMGELQQWLASNPSPVTLLVSSVPLLLPPLIGMIEYLSGLRLWHAQPGLLKRIGNWFAHQQLAVARKASFDHWPLYARSWQRLLQLLEHHPGTALVLSGDVHFSYGVSAQATAATAPRLYQFVCTPLQNALAPSDRRKIEWQSMISGMHYGGLRTHMLPLRDEGSSGAVKRDILYQDTLAILTLQPETSGGYRLTHDYLGLGKDGLTRIASLELPMLKADLSPATKQEETQASLKL